MDSMKVVTASREILANTKEYTLTRMTHERGLDNPPHHHPHRQVMYVLEGHGEFIVGNERYKAQAGTVLEVGPDVPHTLAYSDDTIVWLEFFTPGREDFK